MKKYPDLTRCNVPLTRDQHEYVAERAAEDGYATPGDYVRELIRRDAQEGSRQQLENLALEGIRSGPPIPIDGRYFADLRARIRKMARAGE